ncbi:uncharacterized protein METZ01_LOCUS401735 [marine metagenome]|uniref:EamA domain-containing protein n=1 Tax=marine metagenome TaxID=408172 RepID=A0A382VSH2_9ZZZZ
MSGLIYEFTTEQLFWPTVEGWLIVLFVTIFASFISHLFYIRSIQLIGVGIGGLFTNLVPIFASVLAIILLAEAFGIFHAVSLALVMLGLWLAQRPDVKISNNGDSSS